MSFQSVLLSSIDLWWVKTRTQWAPMSAYWVLVSSMNSMAPQDSRLDLPENTKNVSYMNPHKIFPILILKNAHWILVHAQDSCACTAITRKINGFCQKTFFYEWDPYGRWGGHPAAKIRVEAMRVFFICMISHKKTVFRPADVSWFFGQFSRFSTKNEFFQKCPRSVWECSGGIPDLLEPIFNKC